MINSMTAYATCSGNAGGMSWVWEMRGVNARGLDIRLRIPDSLDGLEATARTAITKSMARGNVSLNLRLTREEAGTNLQIDQSQLDTVLRALDQVQERAFEIGVTLAQPNAADVLAQRGVLVSQSQSSDDQSNLMAQLKADIPTLIAAFLDMRAAEGAALGKVVADQIDQIATLTAQAKSAANDRKSAQARSLSDAVARITQDVAEVSPDRLAQELAILAVKSDITEELDRLTAHVEAARVLLQGDKPVGRKLDFLSQEFNREANTLCSKAGSPALTAIGLELKAVIDQMREQIQNVE